MSGGGTILTVGATANDVANSMVNGAVQQVIESSSGPAMPGEMYMGEGIILSDPSEFFQ